MEKIKKSYDYASGAFKNPELFKYYMDKAVKYKKLGYADELLYWKHDMENRSADWYQAMQIEVLFGVEHIRENFNTFGKNIKCLDLGAGPRSRLTYGYDNNEFDLVAVDPLADEYIKEFGGRDFLLTGRGETLAKQFEPNTFHMVYSCNAIDHVDSPLEVIRNIKIILKKNGVLIICGNIDNGDLSNWLGLHQHNIHLVGDELVWQTKSMKKENKTITIVCNRDFQLIDSKNTRFTEDGNDIPWFIATWKKL